METRHVNLLFAFVLRGENKNGLIKQILQCFFSSCLIIWLDHMKFELCEK